MPIIPRATYRLQLHKDFNFDQATAIVPYLADLGVSHVYCSPFLRARPGSMHGYDIVDHSTLNPEIGDAADLERFVATLKSHGMGQLLDMVPNHMGISGASNAWWSDVLENGQASSYAEYFDIDWNPLDPALSGKVLVPALGDHYGNVLERGELNLAFDKANGSFHVEYFEHRFPIDPREYPRLLSRADALLNEEEVPWLAKAELLSLRAAFGHLPSRFGASTAAIEERKREKALLKARLAALVQAHPIIEDRIAQGLAQCNGTPEDRNSFATLDELLETQAYRLAFWRVAADEINYRRFFDINDLAALRQEHPPAFEDTHRFVMKLVAAGAVDGLRIDHPDGLYDPAAYFAQLQKCYAELTQGNVETAAKDKPLYVLVEKITAPHEDLPLDWAVHGTTGYRYANVVNGVFIDTSAKNALTRTWHSFAGEAATEFEEAAYQGKRLIMRTALAAELTVLSNRLLRIARSDRRTRDFTFNTLRQALIEIVARFPVYRTYITGTPSPNDRRYIDWAVARAKRFSAAAEDTIFEFIRNVLLLQPPADASPELVEAYKGFAMKMQQFTAPVTAKGVEDTAFYRYNRLVSCNEVGGDPAQFGMTVKAFHGASAARAAQWPHTMVATSTHDNKRSEDVRARINVLTEMPAVWRLALRRWSTFNRSKRKELEGGTCVPSRNDEYLLYQTLLGSFPYGQVDADGMKSYRERIERYMIKAMREAKVHTSWLTVNKEYEDAVSAFVGALLDKPDDKFLQDIRPLAQTLAWYGALNSLSVTLVKLTSPGVPDIYQGNEMLDFSLVDPDNRRPVDYELRRKTLKEVRDAAPAELLRDIHDGRAKMAIVARSLAFRREHPELFSQGNYLALRSEGEKWEHALAYRRVHGDHGIIVAVGRLYAKLGAPPDTIPLGQIWSDTRLTIKGLPEGVRLRNVLTDEVLQPHDGELQVAEVFAQMPVALLAY
ncbi:MAG TPA: malto-oligosyltrehalose synthase [Burkholderiales bacterium]|nr:malto-oligosyltrehalose synthase [Burkholderiales bacterium]